MNICIWRWLFEILLAAQRWLMVTIINAILNYPSWRNPAITFRIPLVTFSWPVLWSFFGKILLLLKLRFCYNTSQTLNCFTHSPNSETLVFRQYFWYFLKMLFYSWRFLGLSENVRSCSHLPPVWTFRSFTSCKNNLNRENGARIFRC